MKKFIVAILVVCVVSFVVFRATHIAGSKKSDDNIAIIVLSPHYDDAVLSLGGMLASTSSTSPIVATFFNENGNQEYHTKWDRLSGFSGSVEAVAARGRENTQALSKLGVVGVDFYFNDFQYRSVTQTDKALLIVKLEKAIESLIPEAGVVRVYGPSEFGPRVTHPDHVLLHEAFLAFAKAHADDERLRFYMYEDFPYVLGFNRFAHVEILPYLQSATRTHLIQEEIYFSEANLSLKIDAINTYISQTRAFSALHEDVSIEARNYTKNRCVVGPCEVVYRIRNSLSN
jgi:LmbE family N-acetylglucosaminyl deacetylase